MINQVLTLNARLEGFLGTNRSQCISNQRILLFRIDWRITCYAVHIYCTKQDAPSVLLTEHAVVTW